MSEPEPKTSLRALDRRLLGKLFGFLSPHRRLLWICVALLVVGFAADLLGPYWTRRAVDGPMRTLVGEGTSEPGEPGDPLRQVLFWSLAFLVTSALGAWSKTLQVSELARLGQNVTFDVRHRLFGHLLRLPSRYHDRHRAGELVTRVTSDVENLAEVFTSGVANVLFDLLRVLGVIAVLFFIEWRLALVVLGGIPVYVWISFEFRERARVTYREARNALARANAFVQESISGMAVVQLSVQEGRMLERYRGHAERLRRAWLQTVHQYAVFLPLVEWVNQAIVAITFVASVWLLRGEGMSVGVFVQYWFYLRLIFDPLQQIADRYNLLQSALSSSERIVGILDEEAEGGGEHVAAVRGALSWKDVTLRYGAERAALEDVRLDVSPGETVALVGATGSGKTSLARLAMRLYEPEHGEVRVDGVPVAQWSLPHLRRSIAIVPQDVFLFADSILENVRLRDESVSEERVVEACQQVGADDFVRALPAGYATRLGERGVDLSVGQRQLLAFARALVHEPAVLVLDEATSSVDSETEARLQEAVETLRRGRTCLVVAHRLSTVRRADRIVVLHKARIREEGRHSALMAKDGIYARLVRLHFHGAEETVRSAKQRTDEAPSRDETAR